MSVHMLIKYADLHAYQRIQLILSTYGAPSLQVNEIQDVSLCESQSQGKDLMLENIQYAQGLVVCWGRRNLVTYCTKS